MSIVVMWLEAFSDISLLIGLSLIKYGDIKVILLPTSSHIPFKLTSFCVVKGLMMLWTIKDLFCTNSTVSKVKPL